MGEHVYLRPTAFVDAPFGRPQGLAFDESGALYVADALAGSAGIYKVNVAGDRPEIELVLFGHVLAHVDLQVTLHVGDAVEEEDALDEALGVFHLLDGLLAGVFGQPLVAPVPAHHGVDEVLVDRGELRGEDVVENLDDLVVALHRDLPWPARTAGAGILA